jgi:hypothetical protein
MDPLPMLREMFPEENDEKRMEIYGDASLSMKQKYILQAMFDLIRLDAPDTILEPWYKQWVEILMHQNTCAITEFHLKVWSWWSAYIFAESDLNNFVRTHLSVLDDAFEKEVEAVEEDKMYATSVDKYELFHHYTDALTLIAENDDLSHILADLKYSAPTIYEHIQEHAEYLVDEETAWLALVD